MTLHYIAAVRSAYHETTDALHKLWSDAVGMPGYDKARWMALANAIDLLARAGATAAGLDPKTPLVDPVRGRNG